jgi:aspartyl-tRNA synthetase
MRRQARRPAVLLCGEDEKTRKQLSELRLEMGSRIGLREGRRFKPLWVVDFPLLEWDEDSKALFCHAPPLHSAQTGRYPQNGKRRPQVLKSIRADAYDLVLNGVEIGGGSIRIHDRDLQSRNFKLLGFTAEEAEAQFGFLLGAFEYGAPAARRHRFRLRPPQRRDERRQLDPRFHRLSRKTTRAAI